MIAVSSIRVSSAHGNSIDHLVGDCEYARWDGEMERARSLAVDNELKSRRLQHRNILRMLALQDSSGHCADFSICIEQTGSVAHQAACCRILPDVVNRGHCILSR